VTRIFQGRAKVRPVRSGDGVVAAAEQLADDVLFPAAAATEAAGLVPRSHLDRLAEAGLYGLVGPVEAGGLGGDRADLCAVAEALASGCLATAFVWVQHHRLVRALAAQAPSPLAEAWLGPLCRGERRAGVALAGLLPGPARLVARPVDDGWVLDGSSPWVTGWDRIDVVYVAATGPAGAVVWVLVDAVARPGLSAHRLGLVAADASATVRLDFAGLEVPAGRVVAVEERPVAAATEGVPLRVNGSLALGVARRCCRLLGPTPLDEAVDRSRGDLDRAGPDGMAQARAAASELALRAAAALMVHQGSPSVLARDHAARLAREALFLLVFGTRPPIRAALLERLQGGDSGR
jgi:alkylation response protein AidB-like acyl-CoA dehydrogenase